MIVYSYPLLLAGLSGTLNDALDKVILRRMIGEEEGLAVVGKYGAGYKIGVLNGPIYTDVQICGRTILFERAKYADARKTYADVMSISLLLC